MTLGGINPEDANLAQVSFTVHKSGDYNIAIMFSSRHVKGSPFTKKFEAGRILFAVVFVGFNQHFIRQTLPETICLTVSADCLLQIMCVL